MSEPSYKDRLLKLERHIQALIAQPLREFEDKERVVIYTIEIDSSSSSYKVKIETKKI
jgi:hypothetical protein